MSEALKLAEKIESAAAFPAYPRAPYAEAAAMLKAKAAELSRLTLNHEAHVWELAAWHARCERLRAERDVLKADAERLDYLDSLATYESRGFMGGTHQLVFSHDFDEPNANFRAAIDAAKEQQ